MALDLAREAGAAIMKFYLGPLAIEQKYLSDDLEPVTVADRVANELIVEGVRRHFPDDGVLAEESIDTEHRLEKLRVWVVDPLDGTNGFIDGNGDFAVQVGLTVAGKPVLGVVFQPATNILYRAIQGEGTWIEKSGEPPTRAKVSNQTEVSLMRLAASRSHRSPRMDRVVKSFGVREEIRRGSVGIKVGLIIEQQSDLYIHLSSRTKQWDTCAPEVILKEAGGRITDLFGQPLRYNTLDIQNRDGLVASNGVAHEAIINGLVPLLAEFERRPVGNR